MERALKKLVPEWYHYNSSTKPASPTKPRGGNSFAIERKVTMLSWKCACGQTNHASHDDPCVKCEKVDCECDHELLELHPLDKISLMSRLSGSLATGHTSSDTTEKVKLSIANMKHDEILSALPHLKSRGAGHYYDGRGDGEGESEAGEKAPGKAPGTKAAEMKKKSLADWASHIDMEDMGGAAKTSPKQEGAKKSSDANPDEITVDISHDD